MSKILSIFLFLFLSLPVVSVYAATDLTGYVNPFIGTAHSSSPWHDSADTFPGAIYPMGAVQWSPDTTTKQPGGYYYGDNTIRGFSLTHFSGRGCNVYEDFAFMPFSGNVTSSPATNESKYYMQFSHSNEKATAGYYRLAASGITTELTVGQHTGYGQFTYPSSNTSAMIINAASSINGSTNSSVSIKSSANQVSGSVTSKVGCGSQQYTYYFAAVFDQPFTHFGTWNGGNLSSGSTSANGTKTGAYVIFDTTKNSVIHVKVSISSVSTNNALANLDELGNNDFTAAKNAAADAWNAKLNLIQVTGGSQDEKTVFYTALYHSFIHPNIYTDLNGEYKGFDNQTHTVSAGKNHYTNIAGWDQYRTLARFLPLLIPNEASDILQSLVDDATQGDGHIPRWVQANADSHGMIGDSGDVYIASGYAFGARNFDTGTALHVMLNGQGKIREGLSDYTRLGYVAAGTSQDSAAMTLEYTNDDYAIAQFAQALNDTGTYNTYLKRSGTWTKLLNGNYIQPRNADGSFASSSPTSGSGFREGDAAQYTWMVPFDLPTLFSKLGGNANAVKRLDTFFTKLNDGPNSNYAFMGNEPSFEVPWEYNFAGAAYKTQNVLRRIQLQLFSNAPGGLPGNDDGGTMSSWYVFSAIGLYPQLPGVAGFTLSSPFFSSVTMHLGNGALLQVNGQNASDTNQYIQSLTLNGQTYNSDWLPYPFISSGATMNYVLGSTANTSWGTGSVPSVTPVSSGTPPPPNPTGDSFIGLIVGLPAIGTGLNSNINPLHKVRGITLFLYPAGQDPNNPGSQSITVKGDVKFSTQVGSITYGYFVNPKLDLGPLSGNYQIFVKINQYLRKQLFPSTNDKTGIFNITPGQTLLPPQVFLLPGDIYPPPSKPGGDFGDNVLDISDYNTLISCYNAKSNTPMCPNQSDADLNDDGMVDGIDYNLLLRSFNTLQTQ